MKRFRLIAIWAALVAILLLAIFSIVGSVLGAITKEGVVAASNMFNSLPMVCFWSLLVCLLAVGFLCFKRLLRSPGLLAAHLGSMLILIGAMWGSAGGHAVAAKLLGARKIPSAYMRIYERYASRTLRDKGEHEIGKLPFRIGLKDFWIEYYGGDKPWLLGIDAAPVAGGHRRRQEAFDWAVGKESKVPFVNVRLKVLRYLPGAREVYAESDSSALDVTDANGNMTTVPARVGQEVTLESPQATLRIVQIFSNLLVREGKAVDLGEGAHANPALKVLLVDADGNEHVRYAYGPSLSAHSHGDDGVTLEYVPGVKADRTSNLPALQVLVTRDDGQTLKKWLVAKDLDSTVAIPLTALVGLATEDKEDADKHKGHGHDPKTYLVMARRRAMVKDYKSRLVVLEEGNVIVEKVIEVNDPLHYGGYHFYQNHYGEDDHGQYTGLGVTSDSGLWTVYAGFILICTGMFWLFWLQPAVTYLTKAKRK